MKTIFGIWIIAVALAIAGCSSSSSITASYYDDGVYGKTGKSTAGSTNAMRSNYNNATATTNDQTSMEQEPSSYATDYANFLNESETSDSLYEDGTYDEATTVINYYYNDSYESRLLRFYGDYEYCYYDPVYTGYWGPAGISFSHYISPYYYSGWSFGFGWGWGYGCPYYGGWNYPYWGWGGNYWNGYYDGYWNGYWGGHHNYPSNGWRTHYGPINSRGLATTTGNSPMRNGGRGSIASNIRYGDRTGFTRSSGTTVHTGSTIINENRETARRNGTTSANVRGESSRTTTPNTSSVISNERNNNSSGTTQRQVTTTTRNNGNNTSGVTTQNPNSTRTRTYTPTTTRPGSQEYTRGSSSTTVNNGRQTQTYTPPATSGSSSSSTGTYTPNSSENNKGYTPPSTSSRSNSSYTPSSGRSSGYTPSSNGSSRSSGSSGGSSGGSRSGSSGGRR